MSNLTKVPQIYEEWYEVRKQAGYAWEVAVIHLGFCVACVVGAVYLPASAAFSIPTLAALWGIERRRHEIERRERFAEALNPTRPAIYNVDAALDLDKLMKEMEGMIGVSRMPSVRAVRIIQAGGRAMKVFSK